MIDIASACQSSLATHHSHLRGMDGFAPCNVPGLWWELALDTDAELTKQLAADPTFHGGDVEGLEAVQAYTAVACLGQRQWRINVAAVPCPPSLSTGKVALFMHGHGHSCCISSWGRFWAPMLRQGFHLLAFDAPGFGRSHGAACQTIAWRDWDADLVLMLLQAFGAQGRSRVTVFGQCMGGAMFFRALQKSPETFAARHVLHNCTIGTWPQELPRILQSKGGGMKSFWWHDPDHLREANVYREFTALMDRNPELCTFVDLQRDREIPAFFDFGGVPEPGLARAETAMVLGYCPEAVTDLVSFVVLPPRPKRGPGPTAPQKTLLELGLDNQDFKVFVRVRPCLPRECGISLCCDVNDVEDPQKRQVQQILVRRADASPQPSSEFVFERVFRPEASQDDVWAALSSSLDVVGALLEGIGATVFAYGQTGSGKTHTIDGDGSGILGRVVHDLYARLPAEMQVCCQFAQLYNEEFLDLFDPPARLSQDGSGNIVGAKTLCLPHAEALLEKVREGTSYRASSRTAMNDASSRSHAILSLHVLEDSSISACLVVKKAPAAAQLFIVDLAGSERVKRSGVTGTQLSEAISINQSLLALCNVTGALVEDNGRPRAHIPYRDSALTQMLRNSLGGNARTALIACVSPTADSVEETAGTLRFAACATHIQNRSTKVKQQEKEVNAEQDLDEALAGKSVDFVNAEATIQTSVGSIHCLGDFSGPPDSPVVVMLHYYDRKNISASMWEFMFEALLAAGCRYLAPSMPGHGLSQGESSSKPEDYTQDGGPVDVLLQLLDSCGVKRGILLGSARICQAFSNRAWQMGFVFADRGYLVAGNSNLTL